MPKNYQNEPVDNHVSDFLETGMRSSSNELIGLAAGAARGIGGLALGGCHPNRGEAWPRAGRRRRRR